MRIPIIRAILFYLVMVCFLVPIGYFALWGVKNARPNFVSSRLTRVGDRRLVIGYNNNSIHFLQFYCTNLETGVTSTRVFGPMLRTLGGGTIGTKVWLFGKANKNQFTWQMADLENDRATDVQTMEIADVSELGGSTIVIANQFIRVRSNTLESVAPLTGAIFPSVVKSGTFVFKTGPQQILLRKFFRLGWHFRFQSERCWYQISRQPPSRNWGTGSSLV